MNMSKRVNELRQHDRNSCITMGCVQASLSCNAASPTHINTHTHIHRWDTTILSYPLEHLACVEVFLVTRSTLCFQRNVSGQQHVKDSVRWASTLCPELCRKDVFVPSAGGGSRADLIVCTSKCTLHYQRAASLRVTKKATYLAIANWLISLAQIS